MNDTVRMVAVPLEIAEWARLQLGGGARIIGDGLDDRLRVSSWLARLDDAIEACTPAAPLPAAPPAPEGVTTGSCDAPEIGPDACTCRACLMNQVRRLRAEGAALEQPGLDDLPAPPDTAEIRPLVPSPAASAPDPVVPLEIAKWARLQLIDGARVIGDGLDDRLRVSNWLARLDDAIESAAASAPAAPEPPPCRTCGEDRDSQVHIMEHIYRPVKGARDGR